MNVNKYGGGVVDLNAKHTSFGSKSNNKSGSILERFLKESRAIILKNTTGHTFFREYNNYKEILDLGIFSSSLFNAFENFLVDYEATVKSDHYPIKIQFKKTHALKLDEDNERPLCYNFGKANWKKLNKFLNELNLGEIKNSTEVKKINEYIIQSITRAANQ